MLSKMGEFLRAILPVEGIKVAAVIRHDRKEPHHFFVTSYDALETRLSTEDALGETVYHACAVFKTSDSRKASNALGAQAFWMEVDVGEKGYPDAVTAWQAVTAFCVATRLPQPIFVASGRGLHVYWPLTAMLEAKDWLRYAGGLKALCRQHNLKVDPVRTADLASILRPPGTHWRKENPPRLVQLHQLEGPYPIAFFDGLLTLSPPERVRLPKPITPESAGLAGAILGGMHEPNPPADAIADVCAQIGAIREKRGAVPEPHWFAAASLLAMVPDGLEKALAWSSGGYEAEIEEKFARAIRSGVGPTTCAHFHGSIDATTCESCPYFEHITTPLQAPRMVTPKQPEPVVALPVVAEQREADLQGEEFLTWLRTQMPEGYWILEAGELAVPTEDKNGTKASKVISRYPIWLERINTNEANDRRYSFVIKQRMPKRGTIEIAISAGKVVGTNGISELFEQGAVVQDRDLFRKYLIAALEKMHADRGVDMKFDQFGWKDDDRGFLFGRHMYRGTTAPEPVSGGEEVMLRSQWLGSRPGAELGHWRGAAQTFFGAGNEPQAVALLAGFAAPLMKFHATDEGGAVISLVSQKSGTGKTTALAAAASVYGRMDALSLTNIDTKVSKAITFGVLGNLPALHDELHSRDPEVLKEFIVVFTNGRDKMRGTVEGGIRHTAARWQTMLITGSNQSIVDLIQSTGVVDAPAYRVLELQIGIPPGRKAQQGDKLRQVLDRHCGIAGHHWLQYLTSPEIVNYVKTNLPVITDRLWTKTGLGDRPECRFWIRAAASITLAGHLVANMGLLEFSAERLQDWLLQEMLTGQPSEAEVEEKKTRSPGLAALSDYLADHIANTLVVNGPWMPRKTLVALHEPSQRLLIRYEIDGRKLFLREAIFREWLSKKGYGSRQTIKELDEAGVLKQTRRYVTLSGGTQFPGGQAPCIEIDGSHPAMSGMLVALEIGEKKTEAA